MVIEASRCSSCGKVVIPVRVRCPYCVTAAEAMTKVEIGNSGVVQSYTVLEMPPEGFVPPVLLALVQLEQGAATLCTGDPSARDRVTVGSRVRVRQDENGKYSFVLTD